MARALTPQDGAVIITELYKQATGQAAFATVDLSNFVSVGEKILATGMENVINSLSVVIGRTLVASRPYKARLSRMNAIDTGMYTNRLRKISYYSKQPVESGYFNTDKKTNLKNKFTNGENKTDAGVAQSTKSMWEQYQPIVAELNFAGSTVWDFPITIYEDQLKAAFRGAEEFARFVTGILVEHANDIESQKEAFNRLNLIAKIVQTNTLGNVVDLTAGYNERFGTSHTRNELLSTHLKDFLPYMVFTIKQTMRFMTERSIKYHDPMTKEIDGENYSILRHTPLDKQMLYMYAPLFAEAEALVLPEIFNPQYLDIDKQYEGVDFWQSNGDIIDRPSVSATIPGKYHEGQPQTKTLDYVVALLTDEDGLLTDFQLERTLTTPLEARKGYRNTWLHMSKNAIVDPTENAVLFVM